MVYRPMSVVQGAKNFFCVWGIMLCFFVSFKMYFISVRALFLFPVYMMVSLGHHVLIPALTFSYTMKFILIGISRSAKGYCLISVLETMKTYSAEEGLTEEAVVTKLRICRYHHLYLHSSLRNNSSGLGLYFRAIVFSFIYCVWSGIKDTVIMELGDIKFQIMLLTWFSVHFGSYH